MAPPDVMGTGEVCELLGISRQALAKLRQPAKDRAAFPEPTDLKVGPVWDAQEVRAWNIDRTGRVLEVLRWVRSGVALAPSAKRVGIPESTARRHLRTIGWLT